MKVGLFFGIHLIETLDSNSTACSGLVVVVVYREFNGQNCGA